MIIPSVQTGVLLTKIKDYEDNISDLDLEQEEIDYLVDLIEQDISGEVVVI